MNGSQCEKVLFHLVLCFCAVCLVSVSFSADSKPGFFMDVCDLTIAAESINAGFSHKNF